MTAGVGGAGVVGGGAGLYWWLYGGDDDATFDADDIIVEPGGRNILERLRSAMRNQGFDCSDVEQHSHYSWAFDCSNGNVRSWVLVQYPDPWLLIVDHAWSWFSFLRKKERLEPVLIALHESLESDDDFSNIQWFTYENYSDYANRCGAKHPVLD